MANTDAWSGQAIDLAARLATREPTETNWEGERCSDGEARRPDFEAWRERRGPATSQAPRWGGGAKHVSTL